MAKVQGKKVGDSSSFSGKLRTRRGGGSLVLFVPWKDMLGKDKLMEF
jgi:hypothetical protein